MLILLSALAFAVPLQLQHQGRLFDSTGLPRTGNASVEVKLYDGAASSVAHFAETHPTVGFDNGYFSLTVGSVGSLDLDDLDPTEVWVELAVDGAVLPRQRLRSTPYAMVAGSLKGGVVDASEIRIGGNVVIDSTGTLAGGPSVTLESLTCSSGQVPLYSGSSWGCSTPADEDTLAQLSCTSGNVPTHTGSGWSCATPTDSDTFADLLCQGGEVPRHDGVGWRCETVDSTLSDLGTCTAGDIPRYLAGAWTCTPDNDSQYTPGFGLSESGGAFAVDTTLVQQRITGTCTTTQKMVGVNEDGSVQCEDDIDTDTVYLDADAVAAVDAARLAADTDFGGNALRNARLEVTDTPLSCGGNEGLVWADSAGVAWSCLDGTPRPVAGLPGLSRDTAVVGACKELAAAHPSAPDGQYWIDPSGGSKVDAYQVECNITDGGWTLVWHGYPTHARYLITDLEKVSVTDKELSFDQIRAEGPHIDFHVDDDLNETAYLWEPIPFYFNYVSNQSDGSSPTTRFFDLDGTQDVTLANNYLFFGYGNSWRVFYTCINVHDPDYTYLGGYSPACTPRASLTPADYGCSGSNFDYCDGNSLNNRPADSGLGVSLREYQETRVWVR